MEGYYLVCTKCNGYYELNEGESPDDFNSCECGGELTLVHDIYDYYENNDSANYEYDYSYHSSSKGFKINKGTYFIVLIIIMTLSVFFFNGYLSDDTTNSIQGHSLIGSDSRGYVIKDIYATNKTSNPRTIAIVTGIHPRETLSKNVTSDLITKYPLDSSIKIVHYSIMVTNNPDNYSVGRNNGEGLAADYILPDILKSTDDLVIICHDHIPGYGEGFYIATPAMDEKSVKLAESVNNSMSGLNYFKSNNNNKESSSSALKFSKPLANGGFKTFVYEIPEWKSYKEAYSLTRTFIDKCFYYV